MKKFLKFIYLLLLSFVIYIFLQTPSLDRSWSEDQKILASISFSWNTVDVKNIRNFQYKTANDYEVSYYDRVYDLEKIDSVYYIVEPFSDYDWPAHTMLSFWFEDWTYISVSAEIRKEVWEEFSAFLWLLNKYEIVYVIWDEKDLVKLRANVRKDIVRLYPIKADKEKIKKLFVLVMKRADYLSKTPEFYNTLYKTCTTSILDHVNELRDDKISWFDIRVLLPSDSDKIAYENWLIDTKLSLEEAREYYKINYLSEKYADNDNYSKMIRRLRK